MLGLCAAAIWCVRPSAGVGSRPPGENAPSVQFGSGQIYVKLSAAQQPDTPHRHKPTGTPAAVDNRLSESLRTLRQRTLMPMSGRRMSRKTRPHRCGAGRHDHVVCGKGTVVRNNAPNRWQVYQVIGVDVLVLVAAFWSAFALQRFVLALVFLIVGAVLTALVLMGVRKGWFDNEREP